MFFGWIQRPRPYLQMVKIDQTVHVAEWLALAEKDRDEKTAWLAEDFVLVTNYGDGPAYDIKLSGSNCRPRVRLRDTGRQEVDDGPVVPTLPIWSNRLGALQPGGDERGRDAQPRPLASRPLCLKCRGRARSGGSVAKSAAWTWRRHPSWKPAGRARQTSQPDSPERRSACPLGRPRRA